MADFGSRLANTFATRGQLSVGIDPHSFLLSEWGLPHTADGAREFGLRVVDAVAATSGIVKPQIAFFERFGSAGYAALESVLRAAREAGLLVIADAKRGDVGSTVAAYGEAWLSPGSPLEVDAMTVVAYQGVGSLKEPIELAVAHGKGMFIVAAASNPEAVDTQSAVRTTGRWEGRSVGASIVGEVQELNSRIGQGLGPVGVVIGATTNTRDYGIIADDLTRTPILAPGFGEQGALVSDAKELYGESAPNVIAHVGRGVLRAGRNGLAQAIADQAAELKAALDR